MPSNPRTWVDFTDDLDAEAMNDLEARIFAGGVGVYAASGMDTAASAAANATALQNTINAANAAGGGIVQLGEGTYDTAKITCKSKVHLRGVRGGNTTLRLGAGQNTNLIESESFLTLTGTAQNNLWAGSSQVTIADVALDGNRDNNPTGGIGLAFYGYDLDLRNVVVYHNKGVGVWIENSRSFQVEEIAGSSGFIAHLDHVDVYRNSGDGIRIYGPTDAKFLRVNAWKNGDETLGGANVKATGQASGTISGVTVYNNAVGLQMELVHTYSGGGAAITGCTRSGDVITVPSSFKFHTGTPLRFSGSVPSGLLPSSITIASVNTSTEVLTKDAGSPAWPATDTPMKLTAASPPGGLTSGTTYYVIRIDDNTAQLAASAGGAAINLTSAGTGKLATSSAYYAIKVTDTTLKVASSRSNAEANTAITLGGATTGITVTPLAATDYGLWTEVPFYASNSEFESSIVANAYLTGDTTHSFAGASNSTITGGAIYASSAASDDPADNIGIGLWLDGTTALAGLQIIGPRFTNNATAIQLSGSVINSTLIAFANVGAGTQALSGTFDASNTVILSSIGAGTLTQLHQIGTKAGGPLAKIDTHANRLTATAFSGQQWKESDTGLTYLGNGSTWDIWKGEGKVVKTANETVNNSTALQDDDHLFWPIEANEIWWFRLILLATGVSVNADLKVGMSGPAGSSGQWFIASAASAVGSAVTPTLATDPISGSNTTGLGNGTSMPIWTGVITNGATAGTIKVRWAQGTLTAEDVIVNKGSHLDLKRLI